MDYWDYLEKIVKTHEIIIDRPKGTTHPHYPELIYPLDYGYLRDTTTVDGGGIDIFLGTKKNRKIEGIICTVDLKKNDAEVKIMYGCYKEEINSALRLLNDKSMRAIYFKKQEHYSGESVHGGKSKI
jgi:inorganic pyrophosphatase